MSVGPLVRWSVGLSVGPWVRGDRVNKWKTRVSDTVCVCLSVWGWGLGVDGGRMPLPTRSQRYFDPASRVKE